MTWLGIALSRPARKVRRLFGASLRNSDYLINWSRTHRYIYVEVPKAACSTIKLTLQRIELNDRDYDPANKHRRATSPLLSPLSAPGDFLEALASPDYFRFCFVRDPYSRILSAYLEKLAGDDFERAMRLRHLGLRDDAVPSLRQFLEVLAGSDPAGCDIHWARQSDLLTPDRIAYDFVGRFESFREDFEAVLARIGRDADWIADARGHGTDAALRLGQWIGPRERALIEAIYAEDFDRFGYSRELGPT